MPTISAGAAKAVLAIPVDRDGQPVEMTVSNWSSADTGVATVAAGAGLAATITGRGPGRTSVSVKLNSVSEPAYEVTGTATVDVPAPSYLDFDLDPVLLDFGATSTGLAAVPRDPAGATHASFHPLYSVAWSAVPSGVVSITTTSSGLVATLHTLAPGSATVTCSATRGTDRRPITGSFQAHVSGAVGVNITT